MTRSIRKDKSGHDIVERYFRWNQVMLITSAMNMMEHLNMKIAQCRGGSRAAATSKMECFVVIVNGFQPLTIITKHSILDVAAALDRSLTMDQATMRTLLHFPFHCVRKARWKLNSGRVLPAVERNRNGAEEMHSSETCATWWICKGSLSRHAL